MSNDQSWVWRSTPDTIAGKIPSVAAIIETCLAVPAYWWLTVQLETYFFLVASAFAAPLVLLRSEKSVDLGVAIFSSWEKGRWRDDGTASNRRAYQALLIWPIFVAAAALCALLAYILARYYLVQVDGLPALFGGVFVALLVMAVVGGVTGAIAGVVAGAGGMAVMLAPALIVPSGVIVGILAADVSTPVFWGALAPVIFVAASALVARAIAPELAGSRALAGSVATAGPVKILLTLPMSLGVGLGVFFVSMGVRLWASVRYFYFGWLALPDNFRRLALCTSCNHVPELVPDLERTETQFSLVGTWQQFHTRRRSEVLSDRLFAYLYLLPLMVLWFLPGWLYRLTLKSTAWFWWPLSFLGSELRRAKDPMLLNFKILRSLWAKTTIWSACLTIGVFVFVNLFLSGKIFEPNPLITVLGYFVIIDWSLYPWQIALLAAALISLAVVFLLNDATGELAHARREGNDELRAKAERKFRWIEIALRIRLLLVVGFWLLAGGQALLYFNSLKCWFPLRPNVERWAESIYGDRLPKGNCVTFRLGAARAGDVE